LDQKTLNPINYETSLRSRNRTYRDDENRLDEPQKDQIRHIPKGFAKYLLNGSAPKKLARTREFDIEEGYAMPENLFSRRIEQGL
jgi:hypothetical protein